MSGPIISVEQLSKRYVIGHQRAKGDGLRHAIEAAFRNPLKWLIDRKRRVQSIREEVWALRDVTFSINQGDVVGIIGRNGAGKSTLLKILSRITEPTAGRVRIKGRVASLLEVGTGFHPELTGRENIFLNGAILGMSKSEIRRKFDEIVAFSEIDKFLDTPVKRYSSGMYVRLAFAVAAHLDPEILVVDEVLSVGDSAFQKKCAGKMQDASGGGRTIFFVSHNMSAIKVLCTKAILFSEGKLKLIGSPEQCIREYESMDAGQANGTWRRPVSRPLGVLGFKQLAAQVIGQQPNLQLRVDVEFAGSSASQKIILALDIADGIGASIMQALPRVEPFAASGSNNCRFQVVVDLPPLIPGQYSVTAWIGPHNTETFDYIPAAVSFSVLDSPSLGRTYPHTVNHGYVVPPSTLKSLN